MPTLAVAGGAAVGVSTVPVVRMGAIRRVLRVFGPAWIVMVADVDAASVLTAAKAGSDFGYAMLLPIVLLVPILYMVQEMTSRLAIGTGLGHAELIRERFGFRWGMVSVASMVIVDMLAYVAEFAGIALGAGIVGIAPGPAIVAALGVHTLVVLTGSYRRFEVAALVLSMALFAFVAVALLAHVEPGVALHGMTQQPIGTPGYLELVAATVGAVIMPWMLFYQQAATVEKHLGRRDLGAARWETLAGAIASEALMAAVVIAAAASVAAGVGTVTSAGAGALPSGLAAISTGLPGVLVAIGIVGAGLLAAVVISLSAAWAWAELLRWPHSLDLSVRRAPGFYAVYFCRSCPPPSSRWWRRTCGGGHRRHDPQRGRPGGPADLSRPAVGRQDGAGSAGQLPPVQRAPVVRRSRPASVGLGQRGDHSAELARAPRDWWTMERRDHQRAKHWAPPKPPLYSRKMALSASVVTSSAAAMMATDAQCAIAP